ncbi:ead/Ea22-like family protein [Escherichia coli]|uniref:ead/Ea22-like family protein n=1 Tax=Escherichia coli TaxID=562 RepID=UPI001433096E|nr:ead/Ea22-like family protein [Escherichia coli]NJZ28776.1 ead/Ea22-like family protein [Escherichia coli]
MSNIDKQALREIAAAAVGAHERLSVMPPDDIFDISLAEGTQLDADITALNALNSAANPTTVLALLDELEAAEKRNAELQSENAYIRNRFKELDLLIGKNILVMQAAIIEWQATGDAKSGLAWIYNTLFGPGELPDESEKDAQAYFNRKYAPIDEKLMALHKWFWEQSEAERAAANIGVKGK